jgi:acetyl esterase/lipase
MQKSVTDSKREFLGIRRSITKNKKSMSNNPSNAEDTGDKPSPKRNNGLDLQFATYIKPSDNSRSVLITPDKSKQIEIGKLPVKMYENVVFSTPQEANITGRSLYMDIQVPDTRGKKPLIVFVAGGAVIFAKKESSLNLRTYVAEAGFVVASMEYRTIPDGSTYKEGLADLKSAIRFLRSKAKEYEVDPENIGVWGESAGGYLATLAAVTNDNAEFEIGENLDQSSHVKAVVDKYGPSDVSKADADFDNANQEMRARRALYVNGFLPNGELADPASSPIHYVKPMDVNFLLMHGSKDGLISPSQTILFHDALLAASVDCRRYVLDGANHGDLSAFGIPDSGLPWSSTDTMDIIVDFLTQHLVS